MSQRRQEARGVTTWWRRYRGRPAVQVGLAFTVGLAAFALAALVSPHLRDLDGDAVFVLGIFILMAVLVTEIAARAGRRVDESEQAQGLLIQLADAVVGARPRFGAAGLISKLH